MHRYGDEIVNPRLSVLEDENKKLIAKISELLDKLIAAETFIKELSEKVFLSSDGVGSSLRRMYAVFDVPESKYMKIGLLLKAIKISNC